jgi:hypothetical protein
VVGVKGGWSILPTESQPSFAGMNLLHFEKGSN